MLLVASREKGYIIGTIQCVKSMKVATMFWKSLKNTFIAENSRARAVPSTVMIANPRTRAKMPWVSGRQPTAIEAMNRISICGNVLTAETITVATGNISRGIAILRTSALFFTIARVPAENVSVKKCTPTSAQNRWIAKFGRSACAGPGSGRSRRSTC